MKKLIVWDCDGTLWPQNIIAGEKPVISDDTISIVKELYHRGVIQSIASWNVEKDVMDVLEKHHIAQYFLYPQIAMGVPKPVMLQTIKDELELSKWSDVVFIDDEMFNRAEVVECFPAITTAPPDHVEKVMEYFFTKAFYTEEDRLRVRRYEQERTRKVALQAYPGNRIEFLQSCDLHMEIERGRVDNLARVKDLIERANKMSALKKSYEEQELVDLLADGNVLVVHVWDKYGDYGLSGLAILSEYASPRAVYIDALVVSCRLQGKGIGSTIVAYVANSHKDMLVAANWIQTEYNTAFVDMYSFLNFRIAIRDKHDMTALLPERSEDMPYPTWLNVSTP